MWLKFGINVDVDSEEIHPESICPTCRQLLYRAHDATDISAVSNPRQPFSWKSHNDNFPCFRKKGKTGHPSRALYKQEENDKDGPETANSEDSESEHEKNSCIQFSTLMQNKQLMDRELAVAGAEKLSKRFNFIFLDREKS